MAKLRYIIAPMSAGKSTALLQTSYNYIQRGYKTLVLTSALDDRYGTGKVTSRIGIDCDAIIIPKDDLSVIQYCIEQIKTDVKIQAVFVDECQFLSTEQIDLLSDIVDNLDIPVFCYGIRTDFMSNLFTGSLRLFEIADTIEELKNICKCGGKAVMNARLVDSTEKVFIGGNESYDSMCRKCWKKHTGIK